MTPSKALVHLTVNRLNATLLLTLLIFTTTTQAQESSPGSFTRDIGFNTTFILEGLLSAEESPFSVMYKKYVTENKANRFGIDLSVNMNSTDGSPTGSYSEYSRLNIRLNVGREIQTAINEKWVWFYGGDFIPFYSFDNRQYFQDGQETSINESSGFGIALRPFIAIRYNINPRIYLSAEASVNVSYVRRFSFTEYPQTGIIADDSSGNSFSIAAHPANGLFLFYRL